MLSLKFVSDTIFDTFLKKVSDTIPIRYRYFHINFFGAFASHALPSVYARPEQMYLLHLEICTLDGRGFCTLERVYQFMKHKSAGWNK